MNRFFPSHLVVIHYHLRPCGVRRVLELALPALAQAVGPVLRTITLAVGEEPETGWYNRLKNSVAPAELKLFIEPDFGYFSESRSSVKLLRGNIRSALAYLIRPETAGDTLVWFHNPALGRNAMLVEEVGRLGTKLGFPSIFHHHEFWCLNRWDRWWEMRQCGLRTPASAARALFAPGARVAHICINSADHKFLRHFFLSHCHYLPNPVRREIFGSQAHVERIRTKLHSAIGSTAPLWLSPSRVLRRKNLAEGILLTRWLRPDAIFVTPYGATSASEQAYASRILSAAKSGRWNVVLGILDRTHNLEVADLIEAAEIVLMTSLQEGFGMGLIEGSIRPVIARGLPDVLQDLSQAGYRFPYVYDEVLIAPELVDRKAERRRQLKLWKHWRDNLPAAWRSKAGQLPFLMLGESEPVPFSRLSLAGQMEVLAHPPEQSWASCRARNPVLENLFSREPAAFELPGCPVAGAGDARTFALAWWRIAESVSLSPAGLWAASEVQESFASSALASASLFPLMLG